MHGRAKADREPFDLTCLIACPPYGTISHVRDQIPMRDGTVLVFDLSHVTTPEQVAVVVRRARKLRGSYPGFVLAALVDDPASESIRACMALLRVVGLRLELPSESALDRPDQALRTATAVSSFMHKDISLWLRAYLNPKGVVEVGVVEILSEVLSGAELDVRSKAEVRRWTRKLMLPPLRDWRIVGRLTKGLTMLQAEPALTIHGAAREVGLSGGAAFSHAVRRTLAATPSDLRSRLGWEWILMRFLRRHGLK